MLSKSETAEVKQLQKTVTLSTDTIFSFQLWTYKANKGLLTSYTYSSYVCNDIYHMNSDMVNKVSNAMCQDVLFEYSYVINRIPNFINKWNIQLVVCRREPSCINQYSSVFLPRLWICVKNIWSTDHMRFWMLHTTSVAILLHFHRINIYF